MYNVVVEHIFFIRKSQVQFARWSSSVWDPDESLPAKVDNNQPSGPTGWLYMTTSYKLYETVNKDMCLIAHWPS